MKKIFLLITVLLLSFSVLQAQKKSYNVVFDLTSKDTVDHRLVIRWINEILSTSPEANLEVVYYAKSLDMVTQNKSAFATQVQELAKNKHVAFKVCEAALKNNNIEKSQLLAGVGTVPDGIYEIISKQQEGWGYIKVSH